MVVRFESKPWKAPGARSLNFAREQQHTSDEFLAGGYQRLFSHSDKFRKAEWRHLEIVGAF